MADGTTPLPKSLPAASPTVAPDAGRLVGGEDAAGSYLDYRREVGTDDLINAARQRQKAQQGKSAPAAAAGVTSGTAPLPANPVAGEGAAPGQGSVLADTAPSGTPEGAASATGQSPRAEIGSGSWMQTTAEILAPMLGGVTPQGRAGIKAGVAAEGAAVADVAQGAIELPKQAFAGVSDAVGNVALGIDDLATWLNDNVADLGLWKVGIGAKSDTGFRDFAQGFKSIEPGKTVTSNLGRGVTQFLTTFLGPMKLLKGAGAGTLPAAMGAGAISDFLGMAGSDQTLAELVQSVPELANPITDFLSSQPGDNEAVARLKNAVEGLGLGALTDGFIKAMRLVKDVRAVRAQEGAAAAPSQVDLPALDQGRDFLLLGDPKGPLMEVRPSASDAPAIAQGKLADAAAATETGVSTQYAAGSLAARADAALKAPKSAEAIDAARTAFQAKGGSVGAFGPVHEDLRGNWQEGVQRLLAEQDGEIPAAIVHPEVGGIDLVWGNAGTGASDGAGLAKIAHFHPEIIDQLPELIGSMKVQSKTANRIRLETPDHMAVVRLDYDGEAKTWLLTAYEKKGGKGGATGLTDDGQVKQFGRTDTAPPTPGAEGNIGSPEVYINFARIETADDVKQVMQDMADAFKGDIDEARRGVRSNEATQQAADALGMSVEDVLARRKGQGFNAEEALAARRLLTASGEKLLEAARKAAAPGASPADQFVFRKMMATHYAIQAEVIGARTETARALQAWSIPAGASGRSGGQEQMKALEMMLAGSGGVDVSAAMAKRLAILAETGADAATLNQFIRKGAGARTMDAVKEVWINGLLSSPTTHIVNTTSNFFVAMQQILERGAAGRIAKLTGSGGVADGEAAAMLFGMVQGLKDDFRVAGKALRTGEAELGFGKMDQMREPAVSAAAFNLDQAGGLGRVVDVLGHVTRVPGRLLETQDAFFKSMGYRTELWAQAYRQASSEGLEGQTLGKRVAQIVNDPPENIRLAAADAALYNTFTNETGEFGKNLMRLRNGGGALNPLPFIVPFVRTPLNIARYSFERTPLAPLVGQWRADIAAGGAKRDVALARLATGSAAMAVAADLAMNGMLTGKGPSDPKERQALLRTGWQPYSVKIGDKWHSYARTDPIGMTLGFAADFTEAMNRGDVDPEDVDEWDEVMAGGIAAVSQFTINKTYLSGLSDFMNVMSDPKRFGEGYVDQWAGSFLPFTSALGAAERAVDPTSSEINSPMDAVLAKLPGLSSRLTPRRDLWGQKIKRDEVYGRAYDVLSPVAVSQVKDSPIDAEMLKQRSFVEEIKKKTNFQGVDIDLKQWPEVYDAYKRLAGNELKHPAWNMGAKDFLDAVVSGKHQMAEVYRMLSDGPDGTKGDFIKDTVRAYRELAQEAILADPKFARFAAEIRAKQQDRQQRQLDALQPQ